ncbi:AMP-binding protein [Streptomyces sp. NPDC058644]|uniref:AMP-binding protein n=1 Tax=unclassified Streptomyces TaxID=2593676 RepID=UPI0036461A72
MTVRPVLPWPDYSSPAALTEIETVPLAARNLPAATLAVLERAAELWPDRLAMTFLPRAEDYTQGQSRTYADLLSEVRRIGRLFRSHGVGRSTAVGLFSPNTALLPSAPLAAQSAGIAAPVNPHLPAAQIFRLLQLAQARIIVAAGTGASAVGRPDPHAGEVPIVYVSLAPGAPEPQTRSPALVEHARSLLHEKAAVPKDVIVVDSLPVTAVGKPTKVPLRMNALKQAVLDELAAVGLPSHADAVACHIDGAGLRVTVPRPAEAQDTARLTAALGRYTFDWAFTQV